MICPAVSSGSGIEPIVATLSSVQVNPRQTLTPSVRQ
jgi:hypothetical protein